MKSKILSSFTLLISFLLILLGVILSLVCFVYVFSYYELNVGKVDIDEDNNYHGYQTLRYDSSNDEFTFGMMTSVISLEEGIYKYRKTENGGHELISHFGEVEYICSGKCFCMEEEIERRTIAGSGVLSKGVMYLLAAVTSAVAYNLAHQYFEEECLNELHEVCPLHAVQSEVEDCDEVIGTVSTDKISSEEETTSYDDYEEGEDTKFRCRGRCTVDQTFDFWTFLQSERIKLAKFNRISKYRNFLFFLRRKNTKNMFQDKCRMLGIDGKEITVGKKETPRHTNDAAKEKFINTVLDPFCKDGSPIESERLRKKLWKKQKKWLKKTKNYHESKLPDESPLKTWCMAEKFYSTDCRLIPNN